MGTTVTPSLVEVLAGAELPLVASTCVSLAVLVSRNGRQLPIEATVCGGELTMEPGQHLKLRGPDPLRLESVGVESGAE